MAISSKPPPRPPANPGEVIAKAIWGTLRSPNVPDSNLEPANVVDAIDRLATAGFEIAKAIDRLADACRGKVN